jgi:hypothetical protein
MNLDKEADPSGPSGVATKDGEPGPEEHVPLSVRNARNLRRDLWPSIWMSFASILILAAALAILSYRIEAQSCHYQVPGPTAANR